MTPMNIRKTLNILIPSLFYYEVYLKDVKLMNNIFKPVQFHCYIKFGVYFAIGCDVFVDKENRIHSAYKH